MSGVTDPAEEYFKDGLWGWVTDQWKKLVADASGFLRINIAAQDIDVEVKQQTAADLTPGVMGWDGSAWRKLPLMWGYSERWAEDVTDTAVGAGNVNVKTTAVPAGYVYVLEALSLYQQSGAAKAMYSRVLTGSETMALFHNTATASGKYQVWSGRVTLSGGDQVEAWLVAPGDGQSIIMGVRGYKMKVTE